MEELGFYSQRVLRLLREAGAGVFDRVRVLWGGMPLEGVLLPRPEYGDPDVLIIKLDNGYNVGVHVDKIERLELTSKGKKVELRPAGAAKLRESLPLVAVLGTGGTIASRVDYTTGAVYPSFTAEDVYTLVPELADIARLELETIFNIFSEDMTPKRWEAIAERVAEKLRGGAVGVVVAHGTDTMGYTAAALSFALANLPGPVALVGAQRSSDRPSSDTALNLVSAVTVAARAPFAEVVVVMHGETSDTYALVHRGTRVRKCHTSRRDAFRSINSEPLAVVRGGRVEVLLDDFSPRRSPEDLVLRNGFDERVALVKFYPGMSPEVIDFLVDKSYHGIVIEATGLGHVREELLSSIGRAVEEGVAVAIASQCLWGRVNLNVYRRGVQLLKLGVIPCEDMIPETAFVKLSWVLDKTRDLEEVRRMMMTCYAHEMSPRTLYETYPPNLRAGREGRVGSAP